ncbi:MAG TPA: nuclear transport factor 2 family protein [Gemmatimonadaceae bacterium]|nr:nuclear transport factor 2 family protein [Gemmatimonadaceae bacterium]
MTEDSMAGARTPRDRDSYDAQLIADLNDLIQLDEDAVEGYTIALNAVRSESYRDTLVAFRADHKRHIEELGALVRSRGGTAIELPHVTGPFKLAMQALGGVAMSDATVLLAFKVVEGQVRDKYRHFAGRAYPADVADVVRRAADDEATHYRWASDTLREMGYGENTIAGTVGVALETLHKAIATPLEAAARQVMRALDESRPRQAWRERTTEPRTAAPVVQSFLRALRAVEERSDVEWMASLYALEATLSSPMTTVPERGPEAARHFWEAYRRTFTEIRSDISAVTEAPGVATVQWTSRGRAAVTGADIDYAGVSVIEHRDGKITRFQAFFDPGALERAGAGTAAATGPA